MPPSGTGGDRDGLARRRSVDAVRLRSQADTRRGPGRHGGAVVGQITRGARRPGVDRGRLELLQPTRAEARRRIGDPRAHRAARALLEATGCRRGGAGELMAKLYTRRGDAGETGLLGPDRVPKDDPRVEAMGAVDELNAVIGLVLAVQKEKRIRDLLLKIQDDLFTVGAELAIAPASGEAKVPRITQAHVARLEHGLGARDGGESRASIIPRGPGRLAGRCAAR